MTCPPLPPATTTQTTHIQTVLLTIMLAARNILVPSVVERLKAVLIPENSPEATTKGRIQSKPSLCLAVEIRIS